MKKVVKFGGSSLASARQFKKVKAIMKPTRPVAMLFRQHQEKETAKTQK